jgi:hypothetical protein
MSFDYSASAWTEVETSVPAADRPEISRRLWGYGPLGSGEVYAGHVLSETAGACRFHDELNRKTESGVPFEASGQHRRGKTGFFPEASRFRSCLVRTL